MAKKVVASFGGDKNAAKNSVKCIRLVRSGRSGSYAFKEEIMPVEQAKEFFAEKK